MGYTTKFEGKLAFKDELKASELAHINKFLKQDIRDHPEWEKNKFSSELYFSIDLELTDDFSGLQWDESEKSYNMVAQVNFLILQMRVVKPNFGLCGKFAAQGKDVDDRWELFINDQGFAEQKKLELVGRKIRCPHCERDFILDPIEKEIIAQSENRKAFNAERFSHKKRLKANH